MMLRDRRCGFAVDAVQGSRHQGSGYSSTSATQSFSADFARSEIGPTFAAFLNVEVAVAPPGQRWCRGGQRCTGRVSRRREAGRD
jgi:hypothetical protein